ncbi:MAG: hypothetical protein IGQ45_03085 [Cyanobacterium sp. T60_A2020_053]|nr:hypothetical protein [Cyanobacterium sp. T60_A2020_053]
MLFLLLENVEKMVNQIIIDTGQIAKQLFLPHWFWAMVIMAINFFGFSYCL